MTVAMGAMGGRALVRIVVRGVSEDGGGGLGHLRTTGQGVPEWPQDEQRDHQGE